MKIEVFDTVYHASLTQSQQDELDRVQIILEGLNSLDEFDTSYDAYDEQNNSEQIVSYVKNQGEHVLPITCVDGVIKKTGSFLTNDEFRKITGVYFTLDNDCQSEECQCGHCN